MKCPLSGKCDSVYRAWHSRTNHSQAIREAYKLKEEKNNFAAYLLFIKYTVISYPADFNLPHTLLILWNQIIEPTGEYPVEDEYLHF